MRTRHADPRQPEDAPARARPARATMLDQHRPSGRAESGQAGAEADQQEHQGVGQEAEVLPQVVEQAPRALGHADPSAVAAVDQPRRDARQRARGVERLRRPGSCRRPAPSTASSRSGGRRSTAVSRENTTPRTTPMATPPTTWRTNRPTRGGHVGVAGGDQAERHRVQGDGDAVVDQALALDHHRQPRRARAGRGRRATTATGSVAATMLPNSSAIGDGRCSATTRTSADDGRGRDACPGRPAAAPAAPALRSSRSSRRNAASNSSGGRSTNSRHAGLELRQADAGGSPRRAGRPAPAPPRTAPGAARRACRAAPRPAASRPGRDGRFDVERHAYRTDRFPRPRSAVSREKNSCDQKRAASAAACASGSAPGGICERWQASAARFCADKRARRRSGRDQLVRHADLVDSRAGVGARRARCPVRRCPPRAASHERARPAQRKADRSTAARPLPARQHGCDGTCVRLDVVGVAVAAGLVVGDDHIRALLVEHRANSAGGLVQRRGEERARRWFWGQPAMPESW